VAASGDIVAMGLAATLSRPGGTVTGMEILGPDLMGKRLQLVKEMMPKLSRVALLHPAPPTPPIAQHHDLVFAEANAPARAISVDVFRFVYLAWRISTAPSVRWKRRECTQYCPGKRHRLRHAGYLVRESSRG
jgi:hypothetical protein